MYKLDLTKEVIASGYQMNPQMRTQVQVTKKVKLSDFVSQALSRPGSFERMIETKSLYAKAKQNCQIEISDDEMKIVLGIFRATEITTMSAFQDMVEELNPNFSIVDIEKGLSNLVSD